jgi:hypothetical protein
MFGRKPFVKEPVEPVPDRWLAENGKADGRSASDIYRGANTTADPARSSYRSSPRNRASIVRTYTPTAMRATPDLL